LTRAIVVHGHFYQPPRENPWLEAVEVQDSAKPYHDWNERVSHECYAPNTAARRVDESNRIFDVVNNFERISFDVGPTLFAWLARHRPDVCVKIVDADRASLAAHGGHGNAMAQVYNHMIMPLATRRDKVTQVRWGIADFRTRFGRAPEGLWLPETAADDETLETLAEAGIRFTVLAPHQARAVRPRGAEAWTPAGPDLDTRRAYLWRGGQGHELAVFFYDGAIAQAVAFGDALERSETLMARLRGGFRDGDPAAQLVHCATDGESYGHHRRFGEMALAAALARLAADGDVALTNYAAFLAAHPPQHEVAIHPDTSWSCTHGIERWRADCGCRTRPGTHQRWRRPLREALDWLRDQIDPLFQARAAAVFHDPWAARDAYVEVLLDGDPGRLEAFLAAHARGPLDAARRVQARRLLEMQRHRLLMYTSCGWFFDDVAGLEPVQCLKYAAMALRHYQDLGGGHLEAELVRRLEAAPSNAAEFRDGGDVYRRLIRPAVVDLPRVIAHYAITGLFEDYPDEAPCYAYRVTRLDETREADHDGALRVGHVRAESTVTGETREAMYAVLHLGGHDFSCGVLPYDEARYERMKADLLRRYGRLSLADLVRGMDEHFGKETFALTHLFLEGRRLVVARVIRAVLDKHEETYRRIWAENRKLVHYLRQADAPIPDALALVARYVLEQDLLAELEQTGRLGAIAPRAFELADEARALGLTLDLKPARPPMQRAVLRALGEVAGPADADRIARATALVEGALRLDVDFGLWGAQTRFFDLWRALPDARPALGKLADLLRFNLPREGAPA
jgi:alpha-amylase/alpha-mannosidase (GH57 family)